MHVLRRSDEVCESIQAAHDMEEEQLELTRVC